MARNQYLTRRLKQLVEGVEHLAASLGGKSVAAKIKFSFRSPATLSFTNAMVHYRQVRQIRVL
jgi:hypothetical protein